MRGGSNDQGTVWAHGCIRLPCWRAQAEQDLEVLDEDDPFCESPAAARERGRQLAQIKELVTVATLGNHNRVEGCKQSG